MGKKKNTDDTSTDSLATLGDVIDPSELPEPGPTPDVSTESEKKDDSEKGSAEPILGVDSASESTPPMSTLPDADSLSGQSEGDTMGKSDPSLAPTSDDSGQAVTDGEAGKLGGSASESSAPTPAPGIDTTATSDTSTSSTGEDVEATIKSAAASQSPGDSSVSTTTGAPLDSSVIAPVVAGSDADKAGEDGKGGPESEAPKPEPEADLAATVSEAEPAVAVAPDAMGALKEGANKVGPALKQFAEFEAEFDKLESEAKARFAFARQKATEFVAAMEAIYQRG